MISGEQPKLLLQMDEKGNLQMNEEQANILLGETKLNWKLVRERDGLTKKSNEIIWISWDNDGCFKSKHDTIAIGRSLLMSPFNSFFTWQTTEVTEIVEQKDDYIKFKTRNSVYELFKIAE